MSRALLLTLPAVILLAACGSPSPSPYEGYRYGYNDGYRSGYNDRYGYAYRYSSYGYNDYAYGSGSPRRHRDLQRPSDY